MEKQRLAQHIRTLDLLRQSMADLAAWCQALGQSGRGTKEELVEKLHKEVWLTKYDGEQ